MKMKTIVLTGGGTAGHIMPNIALLDELKKHFNKIYYIGTSGMEKNIVKKYNIPFYEITASKFTRKLSFKLFALPFKLLKSISEAKKILKQLNVDVIFSKGGYVSVPVAIAGKKLNIPVVTHESDLSMGLANRIITKYAKKVCVSFPITANKNKKCIYTGSPIRKCIFEGNKQNVLKECNFDTNKPTILFVGGSLGAKAINDFVTEYIDKLTQKYNILHIAGKNTNEINKKNYRKVKFANNIQDYFSASDIVISRSGANTIFELCSIEKPMILIPLPKGNSRGDQVENAKYFADNNLAYVLPQEKLNYTNIVYEIEKTLTNKEKLKNNMKKLDIKNANKKIVDIILEYCK